MHNIWIVFVGLALEYFRSEWCMHYRSADDMSHSSASRLSTTLSCSSTVHWLQDHGKRRQSLEKSKHPWARHDNQRSRLLSLETWYLGQYKPQSTCALDWLDLDWCWLNSMRFNRFQPYNSNNPNGSCSDLSHNSLLEDQWDRPTLWVIEVLFKWTWIIWG